MEIPETSILNQEDSTLPIEIRPERPDEQDRIRTLIRDAFGRAFEAIVVDRLRAGEAYQPGLALVALTADDIVGHIMITAQDIVKDDGRTIASTILAPLAVHPSHQGRGIGERLTRAALIEARRAGHRSMMLIGHPTYYPRFGFRPASTWGIRYAKPIPDEVFMAIELAPGGLENVHGTVTLSPAFDERDGVHQ